MLPWLKVPCWEKVSYNSSLKCHFWWLQVLEELVANYFQPRCFRLVWKPRQALIPQMLRTSTAASSHRFCPDSRKFKEQRRSKECPLLIEKKKSLSDFCLLWECLALPRGQVLSYSIRVPCCVCRVTSVHGKNSGFDPKLNCTGILAPLLPGSLASGKCPYHLSLKKMAVSMSRSLL